MNDTGKNAVSPIFIDTNAVDSVGTSRAIVRRGKNRRIAFGWYGGKFSHLRWLLPLLPPAHRYCEPFGGSGAVLLNRAPCSIETYNDIDGHVVNFFRVLRSDPDELARQIALTPFSREEFHLSIYGAEDEVSDLERTRRFYVRARQARTGMAQTATLGRWANCRSTSRSGMSGSVSRWLGGTDALGEIAERLARVQIENRPATDVIAIYDDRDTLLYCDPPYVHEARGDRKVYGFEMSRDEHLELAAILDNCKSKTALSGYRCELMDDLYGHWRRHDAPVKNCHATKTPRRECLWTNY